MGSHNEHKIFMENTVFNHMIFHWIIKFVVQHVQGYGFYKVSISICANLGPLVILRSWICKNSQRNQKRSDNCANHSNTWARNTIWHQIHLHSRSRYYRNKFSIPSSMGYLFLLSVACLSSGVGYLHDNVIELFSIFRCSE